MNSRLCVYNLRALALGNANAISKVYLAFQGPKHIASGNAKGRYCKNNNNNILLITDANFLSPLSHFLCSLLSFSFGLSSLHYGGCGFFFFFGAVTGS